MINKNLNFNKSKAMSSASEMMRVINFDEFSLVLHKSLYRLK